jgi:hypothetical protein
MIYYNLKPKKLLLSSEPFFPSTKKKSFPFTESEQLLSLFMQEKRMDGKINSASIVLYGKYMSSTNCIQKLTSIDVPSSVSTWLVTT